MFVLLPHRDKTAHSYILTIVTNFDRILILI